MPMQFQAMAWHAGGLPDGCDPKWNVPNGYNGCWLVSVIDVLHAINFVDHIDTPHRSSDAVAAALLSMRHITEVAIDNESVKACQTQMGKLDSDNFVDQLRKVFRVYGWKSTLNNAQSCGLTLRTHIDDAGGAMSSPVTPLVDLDVTGVPAANATTVRQLLLSQHGQLQSVGDYLLMTCDTGDVAINVDISDFSVPTIGGDVSLALVVVVVFDNAHYVRYVKVAAGRWVLRDSYARANGDSFEPTCTVVEAPVKSSTPYGNAVCLVYKNRSQLGWTPLPPPTGAEYDGVTRRGIAQHAGK